MANQPCCKATKYFPGRFEGKNGQKATVHWLLFKDYYKFHEITDQNAVKEFMYTLGDEPRIWYNDNTELFTDIDALEKNFKSTFGRATTREEHLSAFSALSYTSGEPLNSYRNRVRSTAARARITDQEHIRLQFINGFPSHIRSALRAKRDASLDDCMLTAQALLSEAPDIPSPAMPIVPASQTNALASQMEALLLSFSTDRNRQSRPPSRNYHERKDWKTSHREAASPGPYRRGSVSRDRYQSDRSQSRDRRSNRDQRGDRRSRYDSSRDRRDRYDSSRDRRGRFDSSRDRRNRYDGSRERRYRDNSRDEERQANRRSHDDNQGPKSVSFQRNRSKSPGPQSCMFCHKTGHDMGSCFKLQRAIKEGHINVDSLSFQ